MPPLPFPLTPPLPRSQRAYLNSVGAAYFDVPRLFSLMKDDASHVMGHVPGVRGSTYYHGNQDICRVTPKLLLETFQFLLECSWSWVIWGFELLLWMDSLSTFKLPYLELSYYWVVTSATLHLMKSCGYCVTLSFLCRVWGAWSWNTDCGWHYYWPVPGVQHRHHWGRVYRWYSWPKL